MVDSCGWIALIDAEINIDTAFLEIFGKYEFVVIDSVWAELEKIQEKSTSKKLLLVILKNKSTILNLLESGGKHTDDILLELSMKNHWPVLTVDRKLKKRLHENNCKVIQVVGSKKIELIT